MFRSVILGLACVACFLFGSTTAFAQASIAGVVRDSSGAVLPGVTVEAASPALIERVRSTVTDGRGQFTIEDLRPGSYVVIFTLPGFSNVRREGVVLTGFSTATVNADLAVGELAETITVTGAAPTVDVRSARREVVVDQEMVTELPTSRTIQNLAALSPAISTNRVDVGGTTVDTITTMSVHGTSDHQWTQDGLRVHGSASQNSRLAINMLAVEEVALSYSAGDAETSNAGVRVNFIRREGSNEFHGTGLVNFTTDGMQWSNFSEELRRRGLGTPGRIDRTWDYTLGLGGPIVRDRLWFFASPRYFGARRIVEGMFYNKNAGDPNAWTYEPDLTRPAKNEDDFKNFDLNLTWQIHEKHKLALSTSYQYNCSCPQVISATRSPEASDHKWWPNTHRETANYTSPLTDRLLLQAGFANYLNPTFHGYKIGEVIGGANPSQMITVRDQATGLQYRAHDFFRGGPIKAWHKRVAVSYVTGSHSFKTGFEHTHGETDEYQHDNGQPLSYRFNNGIPNQLTMRALDQEFRARINHQMGLFVQDRWTMDRMTISGGLRYEGYFTGFPEQRLGPTTFAPNRNIVFPASNELGTGWHDLQPRSGLSYDLRGDGKTAVKLVLNKYVANHEISSRGLGAQANPLLTTITSTTRNWTDTDRDFVPDCDLLNPAANGECGAMANRNFGSPVPGATYDREMMKGWGKRDYSWELSAGVQHQLADDLGVDVGYFRRWFGNFRVTDDRALSSADFDAFSITAPIDDRLPGGGGYVVSDLYNLKPEKFGTPEDNFITLAKNFGEMTQNWDGFDAIIRGRHRGVSFQGGVSTGVTRSDSCEIRAALPESAPLNPYCKTNSGFRTDGRWFTSYTIPQLDVLVAATYQTRPGIDLAANFVASNALVAPSLRRNLSGNAANVTVNLLAPGEMFGDRMHEVDLRVGKILRLGSSRRAHLNLDIFNLFNSNPVLAENSSYASWRRPISILQARFAKVTLQYDF